MLVLIIWKPSKLNIDRFLDVRDYLLLSNTIGKELNAFYYANSLYATQVFKSYGQHLIKTCTLEQVSGPSLANKVKRILLYRDYLPLDSQAQANLRVKGMKEDLAFFHHGKLILTTPASQFLRNPLPVLMQYEKDTDPHQFFRAITMFSILFLVEVKKREYLRRKWTTHWYTARWFFIRGKKKGVPV